MRSMMHGPWRCDDEVRDLSIGTGFRDKKHTVVFEPRLWQTLQLLASSTSSVSQPLRTIFVYSLKKRRGVHHCIRLDSAAPASPSLRNPATHLFDQVQEVGSFEATHLQTRNPARHATHWASQTRLFVRSDTSTVSQH